MLCSICFENIKGASASPQTCNHIFCLKCILDWTKIRNNCPCDRGYFTLIFVKTSDGKNLRPIVLKSNRKNKKYENSALQCEVCGFYYPEEFLILCNSCNLVYHLQCLEYPPSFTVTEWYCPNCQ